MSSSCHDYMDTDTDTGIRGTYYSTGVTPAMVNKFVQDFKTTAEIIEIIKHVKLLASDKESPRLH